MAHWKKRGFDDDTLDFESLEEMLEELVFENFRAEDLDFTKPLDIGFNISIDDNGHLHINEFGVIRPQYAKEKKAEEKPLVEMIDLGREILLVVETNTLSEKELDIRVMDHAVLISNHKNRKQVDKIVFPEKVVEESIRSSYNNGILELRFSKKAGKKSVAEEKK
ncbi:MAG: hypothetical protein AABW99_01095 [archaeon]